MDLIYRLLGITRGPAPEVLEAQRAIAKADGIVAEAKRDKVAEEFRRTERAMKGRPRVP